MILQEISKPSITDWITAGGTVLGVPALIWGIISLFIKDKEKQRKLDALEKIAVSQNDLVIKMQQEVEQLTIQTSEFQRQTSLMSDQNNLTKQRLDLQNKAYINADKNEKEKLALDKQIRKTEIKPYFTYRGSGPAGQFHTLNIANKGHTAHFISLKPIEPVKLSIKPSTQEVDRNAGMDILIMVPGTPNNEVSYKINLNYQDIDGNEYLQEINTVRGLTRISSPLLIIPE